MPTNILSAKQALLDTASSVGDANWADRDGTGTNSLTTSGPLQGTTSLKFLKNGSSATNLAIWQSDFFGVAIPVTAGSQYTFRADFQAPLGATNVQLYIEWFNAVPASTGTAANGSSTAVATTGLTEVFATGTAPAGTTLGRLVAVCPSIAANLSVVSDNHSFHLGATTTYPAATASLIDRGTTRGIMRGVT